MTNFRLFKTEEFEDDNVRFEENGRKLSKTLEKGEITRYEQFLLFPQCFQKACFPGTSKGVIVLEWVNSFTNIIISDWAKLSVYADNKCNAAEMLMSPFDWVENIVGKEKGENAGHQHFLLFPHCFQRS